MPSKIVFPFCNFGSTPLENPPSAARAINISAVIADHLSAALAQHLVGMMLVGFKQPGKKPIWQGCQSPQTGKNQKPHQYDEHRHAPAMPVCAAHVTLPRQLLPRPSAPGHTEPQRPLPRGYRPEARRAHRQHASSPAHAPGVRACTEWIGRHPSKTLPC